MSLQLFNYDIDLYLVSGIGAFILYFKLLSTDQITLNIIKHFDSKFSKTSIGKLLETIVFVILGSLIGVILIQPENYQQAFTSGLSWTTLIAVGSNNENNNNDIKSENNDNSIKSEDNDNSIKPKNNNK